MEPIICVATIYIPTHILMDGRYGQKLNTFFNPTGTSSIPSLQIERYTLHRFAYIN